MSTNQALVTNHLLVDYIRLATYNQQAYLAILPKLRMMGKGWRGAGWLQYKGQKSEEGIFYGLGDQGGKGHFIIQASGAQSHKLFTWLYHTLRANPWPFYCTRLDLQVTKTGPEGWDPEKAYKRLRGVKSVILNPTGNTLYIGSRTSDTFWRIYDKTEKLLRLEIEIKGSMARRTWASIMNDEPLGGIWMRFLHRSRVPKMIADHYRTADQEVILEQLQEVEDLDGKLAWLASLDQLVYKLVNDDDVGEKARALISRWYEYSINAGQNVDTLV